MKIAILAAFILSPEFVDHGDILECDMGINPGGAAVEVSGLHSWQELCTGFVEDEGETEDE
jgi:hypothetical protein